MNRSPALAMISGPTGWLAVSGALLATMRRRLALLRRKSARRHDLARFRRELRRIVRDDPRLVDDIGLTGRQVEDEIAGLPFWQR